MSFSLLLPCRRAAVPVHPAHSHRTRCLRRSRPTCRRLASNAPGLRPIAPIRAFAGALAAQQQRRRRRCLERQRGAKAEGKTKGRGTGPRRKPVCTWGGAARSGFAAVPRGARPAPMQACPRASHDRTRQSLQEHSHDRPPRRRFPRAPQRPEEPGQGPGQSFVSKVLKQAGKASSGKSAVRRPGRQAPASGPARAWDAATRRRASPGRS
jgi:hypothetical protein